MFHASQLLQLYSQTPTLLISVTYRITAYSVTKFLHKGFHLMHYFHRVDADGIKLN